VPRLRDPRTLPWAAILAIARLIYDRFREDVQPSDRRKLGTLLRKSRGNPTRLTARERDEVLAILRNVDVKRLGREVAGAATVSRATRLLKRR
jgi:hypothetical protein